MKLFGIFTATTKDIDFIKTKARKIRAFYFFNEGVETRNLDSKAPLCKGSWILPKAKD